MGYPSLCSCAKWSVSVYGNIIRYFHVGLIISVTSNRQFNLSGWSTAMLLTNDRFACWHVSTDVSISLYHHMQVGNFLGC